MVYRWVVLTLGGVLGCLVAVQALLTAAMLAYPSELMYGEAILYDHARRILEGAPLYQPLGNLPFTVANYTPLYYLLAAAGQAVLPGFAPGRLVAVLAQLAAVFMVARLAMDEGHGWRTGVFAALLFAALGVPGSGPIPWTALYKEDSLALALALGAVLTLRRGQTVPAGLLAAAAVLTKQTYAPMVLAATPWLWRTDRRACAVFLASTLAPIAIVSLALESTTHAFFDNVVLSNVNPSSLDWLRANMVLFCLFGLGTLLAATLGCFSRRPDASLVLTWAGAATQLLALAKEGGASNHWMAFVALAAVFAARAVVASDLRPARPTWLAATVLAINLAVVAPLAASTWATSLANLGADRSFEGLVARARATDGLVLTEPLDVVVLAGKHPLFEPLIYRLFAPDPEAVLQEVCGGHLGLVVLDRPLDSVDWPPRVKVAVEQATRLEGVSGGRLVYAPSPSSACAGA